MIARCATAARSAARSRTTTRPPAIRPPCWGSARPIQTDRRKIAADDFFKGLYETALAAGEIITAVHFPVPEKAAYLKFKQPASRFALVGVFVAKTARGVRVAVTGAGPVVFRVKALEDKLAAKFAPASCDGVSVPCDRD